MENKMSVYVGLGVTAFAALFSIVTSVYKPVDSVAVNQQAIASVPEKAPDPPKTEPKKQKQEYGIFKRREKAPDPPKTEPKKQKQEYGIFKRR